MTQFKDFILKTPLVNMKSVSLHSYINLETKDNIFLESYRDNLQETCKTSSASDYAIMNGANACYVDSNLGKKKSSWYWLRDYSTGIIDKINIIDENGSVNSNMAYYKDGGVCPALNLNLSAILYVKRKNENLFKIKTESDEKGHTLYHTIEFGEYPQDRAKNSEELEKLYNENKLSLTGRTYLGYMKNDGSFEENKEFEYNGKKYVRVFMNKPSSCFCNFKDNTVLPAERTPVWAEVQPLKWKIINWDALPVELNPDGKGTAKSIYVKSEEAIISGIPYSNSALMSQQQFWQNSPIRAMFNGYNLYEELQKGNGNIQFKAKDNYNLKGKGFINEAFDMTLNITNIAQEDKEFKSKLNNMLKNEDKKEEMSR